MWQFVVAASGNKCNKDRSRQLTNHKMSMFFPELPVLLYFISRVQQVLILKHFPVFSLNLFRTRFLKVVVPLARIALSEEQFPRKSAESFLGVCSVGG